MKHIVAIGGGEIGRPGFPIETTAIDTHIIGLIHKSTVNVLFIPTASGDSMSYSEIFTKHYGERLGCSVDVLNLYSKPLTQEIKDKLSWCDIIYVGGGNTLRMMTLWRRLGVDKLLLEAYQNGKVMSGVSAGAICWFKSGLSDSRSFASKGQDWNYIHARGLNLENILLCPHFDVEPDRQAALKNSLRGTRRVAIALENCAALEIRDDSFRILSSRSGAKGYRASWNNGEYKLEPILPSDNFAPLAQILNQL